MLSIYKDVHFCNNGIFNLSPCPAKNTDGLMMACPEFLRNGNTQRMDDVMVLSTGEYMQYACHHVTGSWVDISSKQRQFRDTKIKRVLRTPKLIDTIRNKCEKKLRKHTSSWCMI